MGNDTSNTNAYEKVGNGALEQCWCKKEASDQETIDHILKSEDGKLTTSEAMRLARRDQTLVERMNRLRRDEPFKNHDQAYTFSTSQKTTQLRIAGKYTSLVERKIMLFQFEEDPDVYLQCQSLERFTQYGSSEGTLRTWLFTPSLRETHHLEVTVFKESDRKDNIHFVLNVEMKLGVIGSTPLPT